MKRMTVVRQNRCDQEMNVLLFGCFFLYFAMQLFIGKTQELQLVNGINMLLYLVFVPGFLFLAGYRFGRMRRLKEEAQAKAYLGRMALAGYACFFVLAMAQEMLLSGFPFSHSLYRVLTLIDIPGTSAIFFAVALTLLASILFYRPLVSLAGNTKWLFLAAGALMLCSVFRTQQESYAIMAALFGSDTQQAIPAVPYAAYFLLGIWFEEKKPGFQWRHAGIALAVTVVSAALYRSPLQEISRTAISLFPVYLIYVIGEALSDVTLRFYAARFVADTVELVFVAYAALLYFLQRTGVQSGGGVRTILLMAALAIALLYGVILAFWLFSWIFTRLSGLFQEKVRHKTAVYFLIYTAAFCVLMLLAFHDFLLDGRTLLWKADTVSQYYPRAVFFSDTIRGMLSDLMNGSFKLPMYDFRLGMGAEVTYSLEPLYFLFALFGREHVEFTYTLLILLRFYLSGVACSIFCLYFKKDYFTTFLASCVYVFCGFSFFGGARHSIFMIPMILFPLLILAIEEIVRGKRWYLCTIFVALSLFSNYYYLYMSTIGMGIYFLVRFFCQKEKEKRTFLLFLKKGLTICGSYLLGVAMSCIVLVTTFGLYVGSGRSGSAIIKTPSLFYYGAEWLVRCFLCFPTTANSPGDWLKLGFLPIAFLALAFLFARKGRRELKLLAVISAVMIALPLSGFVLNGFSSVSNRWCYMLALLAAYVVADCLPDMQRMTGKEKTVCAAVTGLYLYLAFSGMYQAATNYMKLAGVCIALTFAGLLLCQENSGKFRYMAKQSLILVMTVAMIAVNAHTLYGSSGVVLEYTQPGQARKLAENTPLRAVEELEDDSFYRVSTPKLNYWTISSSIMLDYNSISMFNSTYNGCIQEYLEKMGSTGYSVTQLFGLSNRTFLNNLAAVKYYAYFDEPTRPLPFGYVPVLETEVDGKKTVVCENQFALPLGYTYRYAISEEELESYDILERQEILMQRVLLHDADKQGTEELEVTLEPLEYTVKKENGLAFADGALKAEATADGERSMTLHFDGQPDSETYLVLRDAVLEGDMSELAINITLKSENNTLSYKFRSDDDRYGTQQQDYVFNLGYQKDAISSCKIKFDRDGEIRCGAVEVYSQPMKNLERYTESLTEAVLEHVSLGRNEVSGTISLDEDRILTLSIPFQKGWTARVDGEEVPLLRANYMYMALPLSAGEHTIELEFAIPGVKYALVIMPSAVVLFVGLLAGGRLRRRRLERKKKASEPEET